MIIKTATFIEIEGLTGTLHIQPNGTMYVTKYGIVDLVFPIDIDDILAWVDEHQVASVTCNVDVTYSKTTDGDDTEMG